MAVRNIMFAFLTALVAVNLIFAEENAPEPEDNAYDQADGSENDGPEEKSPNAEDENEEKQERTFFALFTSYGPCNATRGSLYCSSCTQAVRCLSSGLGIYRTCRGFQRYCNGGRCSFYPGSEC